MITNLKITNFRDVHEVEYDKFGLINEFNGSNGVGKTTIIDAILWLLTDETIVFKKNKDKNVNRNNPYEICEVELTFNDNTFKRKYGYQLNEDESITSIDYYYYNDRRVKSKTEYLKMLYVNANISDNTIAKVSKVKAFNLLKFLIVPNEALEGVDEKTLRSLFDNLLGIDSTSMLLETEDFFLLKDLFRKQGNDLNNVKELLNQKVSSVDKELLQLNAKIQTLKDVVYDEKAHNEAKEEMEKLRKTTNPYSTNAKLEKLLKEKNEVFEQLQLSIKEDSAVISNKELDELEKRGKETSKYLEALKQDLQKLNFNKSTYLKDRDRYANILKAIENDIEAHKKDKFVEIKCPNCGFAINEEQRAKYEYEKEQKIKKYEIEHADYSEKNNKNESSIKIVEFEIEELESKIVKYENDVDNLRSQYSELRKKLAVENDSKKTLELKERYKNIELEIDNERKSLIIEREKFSNELAVNLDQARQKIVIHENARVQQLALNDFKAKKKQLIDSKQENEYLLTLIKQFIKAEIELLKEHTKEIFGDEIDFILVENTKTTDSYKKVCYPVYKGKDYDSWNTANRLELAILVIDKLKKYMGDINLPIIFDIADNIGNSIIERISEISKSQIFYTTICREDNQPRKLIIRKGE